MRLGTPRLTLDDEWATLAADVISVSGAFGTETLEIAVDRAHAGWLDTGANAFLPLAAMLAAYAHEDLECESPVSPQLVDGVREALQLYAQHRGVRVPAIAADLAPPPFPTAERTALYFSRGVDSFHALLESKKGALQPAADVLLSFTGPETELSPDNERQVAAEHRSAAAAMGFPHVALELRAKPLLDRFDDYIWTYAPLTVAAALALGPALGHAWISSAGTRPIGPQSPIAAIAAGLFSTERTRIAVTSERMRSEKVPVIAQEPAILPWLRVCWHDTATNCGRCYKCLNTMTRLAAEGVLDQCRFEAPLTAEVVEQADGVVPYNVPWILDSVPADQPEVRDAWISWLPEGLLTVERFARIEAACAAAAPRPTSWCIVEVGDAAIAPLVDAAWRACGPGAVVVPVMGFHRGPDANTRRRVLGASAARLWWSAQGVFDRARALDALEHGCLPIQVMPEREASVLRAIVEPPLRDCIRSLDDLGDAPIGDRALPRLQPIAALVLGGRVGALRPTSG